MPLVACPSEADLSGYVHGTLSEDRADPLAEHVESCSACQAALSKLETRHDPLVAGLRNLTELDAVVREPECAAALLRLAELGRDQPTSADSAVAVPGPAPATPAGANDLGRLRDYQLLAKLGEGGMGTVYKAVHTKLDRQVAIKLLPMERSRDARAIARFEREMRAAGKLEHPNLVMAHDAGETDGRHFLVMEYVPGVDLSALVERRGPLAVADACELVRQAAMGLECAHQHGLVHRDIKPSNLMLTTEGTVKVLDLGLALLARDATANEELTGANQMMGTADYMAPEQVGDSHSVDIRADVYGLGCTLYKLLVGHAPFTGPRFTTSIQKLMAHIEAPVPTLAEHRHDIPPDLSAVLERMLAKQPSDRYATPATVAEALATFAAAHNLRELAVAVTTTPVTAPAEAGTLNTDPYLSSAMTGTQPSMGQAFQPDVQATSGPGFQARPASSSPKSEIHDTSAATAVPSPALKLLRCRVKVLAAVGLLVASIGALFGGQIIRFVTNQGELVVKVDDPTIEIKIVQDGVEVHDKTSKREFTLTAVNGEIAVLEKEGVKLMTKKFELTRGGTTTVTVTLEELAEGRRAKDPSQVVKKGPPAIAATNDPDRHAAEWVLSIGGTIKISENEERSITAIGDLPSAAFELSAVVFTDNQNVSDAGLAHFKDCKNLGSLDLRNTQVSDAGLACLMDCKNLVSLILSGTRVSDAGLVHLKEFKNLRSLFLSGTQVSDAGLADLAFLQGLTHLRLSDTRISLDGHEQLKAVMPKCQVFWSETNRFIAESVLVLGGSIVIGIPGQPETRKIMAAVDLPRDYFQVRRVSLAGVAKPLDQLPERLTWLQFPEFDRMEGLDLSGVTGLNYDFLANVRGLEELSLANAGLTDVSLAILPKLPTLKRLVLDGNDLGGRGLTHLRLQPELIDLSLRCPTLGDLFAKNLAELRQLKRLSLAGSALTDEGIQHLAALANLESLDLRGTKTTAAGVAELQAALPKCQFVLGEADLPASEPRP
jgi:serine/threonine protein kinase/Leucine-rich repeat (LRR) protein